MYTLDNIGGVSMDITELERTRGDSTVDLINEVNPKFLLVGESTKVTETEVVDFCLPNTFTTTVTAKADPPEGGTCEITEIYDFTIYKPTYKPTKIPTKKPSTKHPTKKPHKEHPTQKPTTPTKYPTQMPTKKPTFMQTPYPTKYPTPYPTSNPPSCVIQVSTTRCRKAAVVTLLFTLSNQFSQQSLHRFLLHVWMPMALTATPSLVEPPTAMLRSPTCTCSITSELSAWTSLKSSVPAVIRQLT